jgi:hypothetical protein
MTVLRKEWARKDLAMIGALVVGKMVLSPGRGGL